MNSAADLLRRIDDPNISLIERAQLRCELARDLEATGDYEAARSAMGDLWQHLGTRPKIDGLDRRTAAEVLLCAGSLTGWLGHTNQIEGAQEIAKDLISESITIFEALREMRKVAEARIDLALCYWRESAFDEARVTLQDARSRLGDEDRDQMAVAVLHSAAVEESAGYPNDALRILTEAAPLFEASSSHATKGKFHLTLARVLRALGTQERREDYVGRALVEYTAASFHMEKAGQTSHRASVENDLGFFYFTLGRFTEAHEHLTRARRLSAGLKDNLQVARVDVARGRVLLAQGRNSEAEKVAGIALRTLEKGDEKASLIEALVTHGTALARLGLPEQSRRTLQQAVEESCQAGKTEVGGRIGLTMIEELGGYLTVEQMRATYERADQLLVNYEDAETLARLRSVARQVLAAERAGAEEFSVPSFLYAAEQTAALLREAHRIAVTNHTVLIRGETGTGKGVLARMIHEWSGRAGEFVTVDCGALSDWLIGSQLFGHRRGSFANASEDHAGAVQQAAGGTLFLDGIAELSLNSQGKLLRLIEHGEIHRIGAPTPERIDVRIIAATNRNLKEDVTQGRFREELFYRLQTFDIEIPPLRERVEDIPVIAAHLIKEVCERYGRPVAFTPEALEVMRRMPLKGNARELRSLIERAIVTADDGAVITPETVEMIAFRQMQETGFTANPWEGCSLEKEVLRYEGELIRRALEAEKGSVTRAARLLGVTHQGLAFILQGRQKELLHARIPAQPRRRSIFGTARRKRQKK